MLARTHDLAAVTALGALVVFFPPSSITLGTALLALLANQLGGVTPDIDQPTAPLWRNLPATHFIGKIFSTLSGGHRFLSHSLLGIAGFGYLSYLLLTLLQPIMPSINTTMVWYAFLIGMASHLLMDMFTKEGVPLFLPIPAKIGFPPVKKLRITTGKWVELGIVFPALLLFNVWLYASHYPELIGFLHHAIVY